MKTNLFSLLGAVVVLFLTGCAGGEKPEKTAETFLLAVNEFNFEEARKVSTEKTHELLGMLESISNMAKKEGQSMPKSDPPKDIKCEVTGENAVCTYCCNEEGGNATIDLIQVDGKWLVNLEKESMAPDMEMGEESYDESVVDSTVVDSTAVADTTAAVTE